MAKGTFLFAMTAVGGNYKDKSSTLWTDMTIFKAKGREKKYNLELFHSLSIDYKIGPSNNFKNRTIVYFFIKELNKIIRKNFAFITRALYIKAFKLIFEF